MKHAREVNIAKNHALNAVNRVEFQNRIRFDDPYKRLAAAVILQAALDTLREETETSYWYFGRLIRFRNEMDAEDYIFYADAAGITISWTELLQNVKNSHLRTRDAADLLCI